MSDHRKIPSPLQLYNTYYNVYFKYFHGHSRRFGTTLPDNDRKYLEMFTESEFGKLNYNIKNFAEFILWICATYGAHYLQGIHMYLDLYLAAEKKKNKLIPFNIEMSRYIRNHGITSWGAYINAQGSQYPMIITHYLKDKDFPFEVILYLGILDFVSPLQKKMLRSIFAKEMYNIKERMEFVARNKEFFDEEIQRVKDSIV